jgi:hypothetical protein
MLPDSLRRRRIADASLSGAWLEVSFVEGQES